MKNSIIKTLWHIVIACATIAMGFGMYYILTMPKSEIKKELHQSNDR